MVNLLLGATAAIVSLGVAKAASPITLDEAELNARTDSIVQGLSLAQVIGQMTQLTVGTVINGTGNTLNEALVRQYAALGVGSFFNSAWGSPQNGKYGWNATEWRAVISRIQAISMEVNGGIPIIYGIDAVHGANYVENAILFPQQINTGASFNLDLAYKVAHTTARDTAASQISWIFGPIVDIARNKLWPRVYETFSEDTYVASVMAEATIRGLQSVKEIAACMKHFIAYSNTPNGLDRENVEVGDFSLLNNFMPPFKAGIDAGALTIMENYISINGEPVIASSRILMDLLRVDLGFKGVLVSDWSEVNNLRDWHRNVEDRKKTVEMAINRTSLDVSMVPNDTNFIDYLLEIVREHPELEARLRESAARIIKLKLRLGLFEKPFFGEEFVSMVGSDDDKALALNMSRESIVLLKNTDDVLPLPVEASVFLTGHSADNIGYQCGGWSLAWQGYSGNEMFPNGVSVRQGFQYISSKVTYFNGLFANGSISSEDMNRSVELARSHDYVVVVIGEINYTEKPGDIVDLALPKGQVDFVMALIATGTKVIVSLFQGRPRLLGPIAQHAHAIINGMLPCEQGGTAMAEIIYGRTNPSGKMPITYPRNPVDVAIPYNNLVTTQCGYAPCVAEYPFGSGLSFTQFNYSALTLDNTLLTSASTITATVTVTNVGRRAGKETVMLFLIQPFRSISVPAVKQLCKFEKIELQAGESKDVSFTLGVNDLSVYVPQIGKGLLRMFENSEYVLAVKFDTNCDVYNNGTNPLCSRFIVTSSEGSGGYNYVQMTENGSKHFI